MIGIYVGVQGDGQSVLETAPIPNEEVVRTSSRLARETENIRCVGADNPEPKRLSRNVAPSGSDPVVPAIWPLMTELAGTDQVSDWAQDSSSR